MNPIIAAPITIFALVLGAAPLLRSAAQRQQGKRKRAPRRRPF